MTTVAPQAATTSPTSELPFPVRRTNAPKPKPDEATLGFGVYFADHLLLAEYDAEHGWHNTRVEPYGPLALDPAAAALHYGQQVFDGLKAFRAVDGQVRLFRPEMHLRRLNASARRLCIPPLDEGRALRALAAFVHFEEDWVPRAPGTALYVRPTILATEPFLGVRPAQRFVYYVVLSPVGAYYPEGINPVRIRVEDRHVRAAEGGLGAAKTGANYAASLYAAAEARTEGYAQVLWLDARERRYLEEVGTMNLFVRLDDEVITPPLGGTILPGVVRDSALTLLRGWGVPASERRITIDEVLAAARAGRLREAWGTGTAAVVSPVGELAYRDERVTVGDGQTGPLTRRLYEAITAIQYGHAPDEYGWMTPVTPPPN
jgi:branched-chain amino acid aminotransferase